MAKIPKLPKLLDRKIYKTGQTRGAYDDQIFQNRVGRNSTVLIPLSVWREHNELSEIAFEKGYTVLVPPQEYFEDGCEDALKAEGIKIGENALVFYELRSDWNLWQPDQYGLAIPSSRKSPLGGHYVARVANTTAAGDQRINHGFTSTGLKGAGIRLYEYASIDTIKEARVQLEALFWLAEDAIQTCVESGMTEDDVASRRQHTLNEAEKLGLLDYDQLTSARTISKSRLLVCPLCLEKVSAVGFLSRLSQAAGRERHDLTVTEINLFHIQELSYGQYNHRPYNLGWGHHHCNVVCKDSGIADTLAWMKAVLERNEVQSGK